MNSQLSGLIDLIGFDAKTGEFSTKEFTITKMGNRILSWTYISEKGVFRLNPELAGIFGLTVSHRMVVVRGGSIGPGFIAKGPIHNLAMKHPELQIY